MKRTNDFTTFTFLFHLYLSAQRLSTNNTIQYKVQRHKKNPICH